MSATSMHPHVATCTDPECEVCDTEAGLSYALPRACTRPSSNHGDGRGCGTDNCPRHGGREDEPS